MEDILTQPEGAPPVDQGQLHRAASAYWATELPQLRPTMLLPRKGLTGGTFPFSEPGIQYVHFARNAIYLLVKKMGLSGREVLLPAYFHGVELEALLAAGVQPRFFAVRGRMRVEPDDIIAALTPRTRAIYLIHYAGFPGPAGEVQNICRERGLLLIEDCALALLSKAGDRPLGSFGDAAVFCLYKTLPTIDGGAIVMREGQLEISGVAPGRVGTTRHTAASLLTHLEKTRGPIIRRLAHTAKAVGKAVTNRQATDWVDVGTQHFAVEDVNLLMSRLSRRVLDAQDFASIVRTRRRNYLLLDSLLRDIAPPVFESLPDGMCPLFYPFSTPHKHVYWRRLREQGVEAVLFWLGGELGPRPGEFPEVDELRRTVLELPCHQDMTEEQIDRLAKIVRKLHEGRGEMNRWQA